MKKRTPASTKVMYVFGIIFLIISAVMLVGAIRSNNLYLHSMESNFGDMWMESIQFIIAKFAPYLGIGIICMGVGFTAKTFAKKTPERGESNGEAEKAVVLLQEQLDDLSKEIFNQKKDAGIKIDDIRRAMIQDMDAFKLQREAAEMQISKKLDAISEAGAKTDEDSETEYITYEGRELGSRRFMK